MPKPTEMPPGLQTFLESASRLNDLVLGERRALTPEEERRLAKAERIEQKAERLEHRARKLRKRVRKLTPPDLYPDSLAARLVEPVPLPSSHGTTISFTKLGKLTAGVIGGPGRIADPPEAIPAGENGVQVVIDEFRDPGGQRPVHHPAKGKLFATRTDVNNPPIHDGPLETCPICSLAPGA